jgi:excisionase family DNA binding protein
MASERKVVVGSRYKSTSSTEDGMSTPPWLKKPTSRTSRKISSPINGEQTMPWVSTLKGRCAEAPEEARDMSLIEELKRRQSFLTTVEVMSLLHVTRGTLCEWVRSGRITAIRTGNAYLFDPRHLADWLAARTTNRGRGAA